MKTTGSIIIICFIIAIGIAVGLSSLIRPRLIPETAPVTEFSAERAMAHVLDISQYPHPPGSAEIKRVGSYIVGELEAMGLTAEIQETAIAIPGDSGALASSINNILARIPGNNSNKAILLDAHYDTRAMTPGASDDSSCVAAVLETARAILAGPSMRNDVILLFSDNEEYGPGLGAAAFIDSHPWAEEVALVLNLEGLGSTGPSLLFETGPNSGRLVNDWRREVSHPVGQSWFQEIYQLTPIGTDLNRFSDAGIPGLNFGYWANGTVYHTSLDNTETFNPRSLQHHGSYILRMARYYGDQNLNDLVNSGGNLVYFTLFPGFLISYPELLAPILAGLCGFLLIGLTVVGIRRRKLKISGMMKGFVAFLSSLLASSVLATGIWMLVTQLHGEYQAMLTFRGLFYNAHYYFFAFAALALAVAASILVLFRAKTAVLELSFGALSFWWLLAMVTAIIAPGFSYLFTWPLLFCSLAMIPILRRPIRKEISMKSGVVSAAAALPGLILFGPAVYVMYHFALAPMIGILAFMVSLLLGLLIFPLNLLTRNRPWRLTWIASAAALVLLITGSLTAGFNADKPRPNAVAYLLNADTGKATWFSAGYQQDSWTRQFFSSEPERSVVGDLFPIKRRSGFPIMKGVAPGTELEAPRVDILNDETGDGTRTLQLRVFSPRGAPVLMLDVESGESVQAVTLGGKRIDYPDVKSKLLSLTYYAVPDDGFEVTLELTPSQPINIQVIDQTWNLTPEILSNAVIDFQPRPPEMMPMPNFDYGTVVVRTMRID